MALRWELGCCAIRHPSRQRLGLRAQTGKVYRFITGKVRRKGEINLGVGVVGAGELPSGRREKIMLAPLEVEWAAARLSIPPSSKMPEVLLKTSPSM